MDGGSESGVLVGARTPGERSETKKAIRSTYPTAMNGVGDPGKRVETRKQIRNPCPTSMNSDSQAVRAQV